MDDSSDLPREAALLIRPLPGVMLTGDEPIAFGGKPQLPPYLDWPRENRGEPEHFFAQIDLDRLRCAAGQHAIPELPETGTIFVFLPLTNDGLYDSLAASVLYADEDVAGLPKRDPPEDLADLLEYKQSYIHPDGTTDGGQLLVRQWAEVIPFQSERAVNPLAVNMAEAAGEIVSPWKDAQQRHEHGLANALAGARPFPPPPEHVDGMEDLTNRIPSQFTRRNWMFKPQHLDWEFIFDWAKEFYRLCYSLSVKHFREMQQAGNTQWMVPRFIRRYERKRKDLNKRLYGTGQRPIFWTFEDPIAVKEDFDWQAKRWLALSQFETGHPSPHLLNAFVDMLVEVRRHYDETDDEGYHLLTRIGMLDNLIKGHDKHAGWTLTEAQAAFRKASENAAAREEARFNAMPQDTRWDSRVIQSQPEPPSDGHRFNLGTMPLQMFGLGFEIQSAVSDHARDVLLLQIGDSFGLPLEIGPDMILQLWINPDDLAEGRFDRIEMTLDGT